MKATKEEFSKKLIEVDNFVARYVVSHSWLSQRDACFVYMREHGLTHILPKHLREQDEEADREREAIQQENA